MAMERLVRHMDFNALIHTLSTSSMLYALCMEEISKRYDCNRDHAELAPLWTTGIEQAYQVLDYPELAARYGIPWPTGLRFGPKPAQFEEYSKETQYEDGYNGVAVSRTILTLRCVECGVIFCMLITGGKIIHGQNKRLARKRREKGISKMGSREVTETYEKIMRKKAELNSN